MRINFNKVKAHNFLSIGDIELDLKNRGYILVEGENNNPADNTLSNGAGKSTIFNSICWCLLGETIQGLKTNIPNIHGEDGCYVTLNFNVDKDEYEITRYREYSTIKNDLKIKINGEDKSGKGLRDSEELLKSYLPDITPELVGNVIILGQGLPHKFSNNTPAGRKELLEQLSKSDFMINDVKTRLAIRYNKLEDKLREQEDALLAAKSQLAIYQNVLSDSKTRLESLVLSPTINEDINNAQNKILSNESELIGTEAAIKELEGIYKDYDLDYSRLSSEKDKLLDELISQYDSPLNSLNESITDQKVKYSSLEKEIITLENVKDVCPTCGQKLPDVHKVDTSEKRANLLEIEKEIDKLKLNKTSMENEIASKKQDIIQSFKEKFEHDMAKMEECKSHIEEEKNRFKTIGNNIADAKINLNNLINIRDNYERNKKELEDSIASTQSLITSTDEKIVYNTNAVNDTNEHIGVLNQINSLVKRDFRGLLLSNVIDFINAKSKEYCKYIFNTDDLNICLDGNNLNISFCNKALENLSGGEQQKVNVIIQLAIRDMMCQYLDFNSNILVTDEIFDAIDSVGCQKMIDLINTKLSDVDSMFIISHHSDELDIPYDDKITIIKDENGVSRLG